MSALITTDTEDENAAGGNISIAEPAGLNADELLLASLLNIATGTPATPGAVTGFTDLGTPGAAGEIATRNVYRVATGSEGPTYTSTVGSPTEFSFAKMLRIFGGDPASPPSDQGASSGTGTTATFPSVTNNASAPCLAVARVAALDVLSGTPTGWQSYRGALFDSSFEGIWFRWVQPGASTPASTVTVATSADWRVAVTLIAPDTTRPYVVNAISAAITASRSPSVTFDAAPLENDIVVFFPSSTTTATITIPSGWENPLGGTTDVESDAHETCCVAHRVTSAEASGSTVTFTATNLYDAGETGNVNACVVRGVDTTTMFAGANSTFNSGNTITPHVLASVTPTVTGGLILSCVAKDGTGNYVTAVSNWGWVTNSNANQGTWLGAYYLPTTDTVTVGPTNITPSAGDEYASITIVLNPAASTDVTGTAAVTLAPATSSASGTFTPAAITGTAAVTLGAATSTAAGTFTPSPVTGIAAVTLGAATATASGLAVNGLWPTSVDGSKRVLDQHGTPGFWLGDACWDLIYNVTLADAQTYLDGITTLGFTFGNTAACDTVYQPTNANGDAPWTGTVLQSAPTDAYWDHVEAVIAYAATKGFTFVLYPLYVGIDNTEGDIDLIKAAADSDLTSFGDYLAARFAAYPNIIWGIGHDHDVAADATLRSRMNALATAIRAGTGQLLTHSQQRGTTAAWTGLTPDVWASYFDNATPGEDIAAIWSSIATFELELYYENEHSMTRQGLREQEWEGFAAGAFACVFGNNPRFTFGTGWEATITDPSVGTADAAKLASLTAACPDVKAALPDTTGTALVSGTGFARYSTDIVVAYCTGTGSHSLDTTELVGTTPVKIRRFDPTDGSFTTITTSEAQSSSRAIAYPGANTAGGNDWVYVVQISDDRLGSAAVTLAPATSSATGTTTPPAFTGTASPTLGPATASASGTTTPPSFTGSAAVTLASATSSASGTSTPPAFTGTAALTLAAATASGSGTVTPPAFTGTAAVTLGAATSTAAGTFTPLAVTGTASITLEPAVSAGSGTSESPNVTGSAAVTLTPATSTVAGTSTPPPTTGTATITLSPATSNSAGTHTPPSFTGTAAIVLEPAVTSATGTSTPPAFTGTAAITLAAATSDASGTFTPQPITGTAAVTLNVATASGTGTSLFGTLVITGRLTTAWSDVARTTTTSNAARTTTSTDTARATEDTLA